ncbi:perilipin-3-like [Heteronotia binoei]|uniref:perilipin-3-like n=1 Tax=Heteronotia binoei TaxID=13085 RepID=UPI0029303B70|nr:perilipin-3-like [Heteronotia binoei]
MSQKDKKKKISSQKTNEQVQQNVVTSVANLSLASSACDVHTTCTTTKDSHSVVESVRKKPEKGIKMAATAAACGVQPVLTKLDSQTIYILKEYTCQGVDKRKEKLPVVQQPANKVISDTKKPLSTKPVSAEKAISSTVVKVKNTVTGVTDAAPKTAQGQVAAAKSTAMESAAVRQKGASNPFAMLRKPDAWLDPFPPVTGQQLARHTSASAEQQKEPNSYSVHMGMLPTKVCQRFVGKMKDTVQSIQDGLFHLHITFDLIEYSKRSVDQKRPDVQEELNKMWLTWSMAELEVAERKNLLKAKSIESQIVLVFRNIIQRLRTGCLALRFHTQGLPGQVHEHIHKLETLIDFLQTYAAVSFQNFPSTMLDLSKLKILQVRILLTDLLDYVTENIILTWSKPLASSKDLSEGTKGTEPLESSKDLAEGTKGTEPLASSKDLAEGTKGTEPLESSKDLAESTKGTEPLASAKDLAEGTKGTEPLESSKDLAEGATRTEETNRPSGRKSK